MKSNPPQYRFSLDFQVRDYECDLEGIVNHAVYLNYLEHTRHMFLKSVGMDFSRFVKDKVHLVVFKAELEYKLPLKSGDRFRVAMNVEKVSRLKFLFRQDIYRYPDDKLVLKAKILCTGINEKGRPYLPESINKIFL